MTSERVSGCLPCSNCFAVVPQDRLVAAERFGKFQRILGPGLRWVGLDCFGLCVGLRSISQRIEEQRVKSWCKTKDNVFVKVEVAIQFAVRRDEAQHAIYRLTSLSQQLAAHASDVVRSSVPLRTLDEVFLEQDALAQVILARVVEAMRPYGYDVFRVLFTELTPDKGVVSAMNTVRKEKFLWMAAQMSAEAAKITAVKAAEGEADAAQLEGEGVARQRSAIMDGLRGSLLEENEEEEPGGPAGGAQAAGNEVVGSEAAGDAASPSALERLSSGLSAAAGAVGGAVGGGLRRLRGSSSAGAGPAPDARVLSSMLSELLLITQYFDALRAIGGNKEASIIFLPDDAACRRAAMAYQGSVPQGGGWFSAAKDPVSTKVKKKHKKDNHDNDGEGDAEAKKVRRKSVRRKDTGDADTSKAESPRRTRKSTVKKAADSAFTSATGAVRDGLKGTLGAVAAHIPGLSPPR